MRKRKESEKGNKVIDGNIGRGRGQQKAWRGKGVQAEVRKGKLRMQSYIRKEP
jgi:hypothetical protein